MVKVMTRQILKPDLGVSKKARIIISCQSLWDGMFQYDINTDKQTNAFVSFSDLHLSS